MKRFVYNPRLQVYIFLETTGRVIDVSNDIISGSVDRRTGAMSSAAFTLQNKHGRYAIPDGATEGAGTKISPMDRIIVRASRVGEPFIIFSGYVDEAPHYQMYSVPVTIRASCPLKLLQHTYFDPGLPYMTTFFTKMGWIPNGSGGFVGPSTKGFGNMDINGSVRQVIIEVLKQIGGWRENNITVLNLPPLFIADIQKLLKADEKEIGAQYQEAIDLLGDFFGVRADGSTSFPSTPGGGGGVGGDPLPQTGNVEGKELALYLFNNGISAEMAVNLLAIARRESSWTADAINLNLGGDYPSSYDLGIWQINTLHAPGAPNPWQPLPSPAGDTTDKQELKSWIPKWSAWAQDFARAMFDPKLNAAKAAALAKASPGLSPWALNGDWRNGITQQDFNLARNAVQAAIAAQSSGQTPQQPSNPGVDESQRAGGLNPVGPFFPIPAGYSVSNSGGPRAHRNKNSGTRYDNWVSNNALDISCAVGTPLVAVEDGTIGEVNNRGLGNGEGGTCYLHGSTYTYGYLHMKNIVVQTGKKVKAGDLLGESGYGSNGAAHLHIGVDVNNGITAPSDGSMDSKIEDIWNFKRIDKNQVGQSGGGVVGGGSGGGTGSGGTGSGTAVEEIPTPSQIADIARQSAFFTLQTGVFSQFESNLLRGERAMANDISVLRWLTDIISATGRVFMSSPDGKFYCFYPDYFGIYGKQGEKEQPNAPGQDFFISDIEIIDLTVQNNDIEMTTHVFAKGQLTQSSGFSTYDLLFSSVASIERPAFKWFVAVDEEASFDAGDFLRKYGARPYSFEIPFVNRPELVWMGAWMEFLKKWSKRFNATATFTYMPELQPGFLLNIGNRIQMYVESVSHSFDYSGGFTTTAQLSSAATLTPDITWLPRAGKPSIPESTNTTKAPSDSQSTTSQRSISSTTSAVQP